MTRNEDGFWSTDKAVILALVDGRIPDGVDPDSPLGRHYAWRIGLIEEGRKEHALLPPLSQARAERLIAILKTSPMYRRNHRTTE